MRTSEEIFILFSDLIKGKINEVKISLTEIRMLDSGYCYRPADKLRELCKKNNILQTFDYKDNSFIYVRS